MENLKKAGRFAYCIGLAGMVIPQLFYGKFGNNFFPEWPHLPWLPFWVWLFTVIIVAACVGILFSKKPVIASLILGVILLATYIFGYLPYEVILAPYNDHLGTWADGLKETALAGGAFVMAGSFSHSVNAGRTPVTRFLEKLIPFGPFLFCLTMVLYGISHFLYTPYISPLVPRWIPGATFWTYFAGTALVCSGIAIVLGTKRKLAAMLLGIMILLWLFVIHIPGAIADPYGNRANGPVSAFSALAFIGIAFVIACSSSKKKVAA